jgi:CBS domain containing-hemolysin-like protein
LSYFFLAAFFTAFLTAFFAAFFVAIVSILPMRFDDAAISYIAANEGIDSWKICVKKNRYKMIIFLVKVERKMMRVECE